MSNAVSALNGATFTQGIATVSEAAPEGMITLRGDLLLKTIAKAATTATGAKMPGPGEISFGKDGDLAWMSPDEVLILCPYTDVANRLETLTKKLAKEHALAVDVSDARAILCVAGQNARDVMAKLAPVDFSTDAFPLGTFRRTRMAQVPAAIFMRQEAVFHLLCFRSNAQYAFDVLRVAASPGSRVGYF